MLQLWRRQGRRANPAAECPERADLEIMLILTAQEEGIPILQNVPLARGLNEQVELDDYISSEFFDAVAEVLHWAEGVRRERGDEVETVYREPEPE